MKRHRTTLFTTVLLTAMGTAACLEPDEPERQIDPVVSYDEISIEPPVAVDVLFVVDNSNSMAEEQAVLADQFEATIRGLLADSETPFTDIRVGVTNTDMGTHGYTIQTCANPMEGDNGSLQNAGRLEGCDASYEAADCDGESCPWLSHTTQNPDDGSEAGNAPIWDDFACIASLGTGGCGFEQQLEAGLVAVTEQSDPGGANEGFLRDDSVLAVVWVTDEDDCSSQNTEFFNPSRDDYGPLCVRCMLNEEELHPLDRYYDGLRALRPGQEERVVVGAVVGVPADGSDWTTESNLRTLRDSREVNPAQPNEQIPSCQTDMGNAYPPVRIAELVSMFGENGVLGSICSADWSDTFSSLTETIRDRLEARCLGELLTTEPGDCRLVEKLLDDSPCGGSGTLEGTARDLGIDGAGRRHCLVPPAHDGGTGWRIDHVMSQCENGELLLEGPHRVASESELVFECRSSDEGERTE